MSDIISGFGQRSSQQNPLTQFGQGLGQIQAISKQRGIQEEAEAAKLAQEQEQLEKNQFINDLYETVQSGNATSQDYANLISILPKDASEAVMRSVDLLTEDEQRNTLKQNGQVFSAFKSGRPDIAINLMEDLKNAYINNGDEQGAKLMSQWIDVANKGEAGAKQAESFFGFTMAQIPGGTDVIDSAINITQEGREAELQPGVLLQQGLDAGLTEAETKKAIASGMKLSNESAILFTELQALKKSGGIPQDKIFDMEEKLRKEYNGRVKNFTEAQTNLSNLEASAAAGNGAGDVALVTAFMKMLDPGSVVRESEFATARNTGGLIEKLATTKAKIEKGEILSPSQRANFLGLAKKYMESTEKLEKQVRTDLTTNINDFGLSADRVFGVSATGGQPNVIRGL